jgi:hypothetical protein
MRARRKRGIVLEVVKTAAPPVPLIYLPPPPPARPWAQDDGSASMIASWLRRVDKGPFIGFVNIYLPKWKITIVDCRWVRLRDREFINLPDRPWYTPSGEINYEPTFVFDNQDIRRAFAEDALAAIADLIARTSSAGSSDPDEVPF